MKVNQKNLQKVPNSTLKGEVCSELFLQNRFLGSSKRLHSSPLSKMETSGFDDNQKDEFEHPALNLEDNKKLVFTAQSCKNFHLRMLICKHAFLEGVVPINPFNIFGYYLYELVDRNLIRNGNNVILKKCDELWVYGDISDGIIAEIKLFKKQGKPIRYFDIDKNGNVKELNKSELKFEDDLIKYKEIL